MRGWFENIILGLISSGIFAAIVYLLSDIRLFKDLMVLSQLLLMIFSLIYIAKKVILVIPAIFPHNSFKQLLLSICLLILFLTPVFLLESAIFTSLIPVKQLKIDSNLFEIIGSTQEEKSLKNFFDKEIIVDSPLIEIKSQNPAIIGISRNQNKLHLLVNVEWIKTEDNFKKLLTRKYQGHIYYSFDYQCNNNNFIVYNSEILNYFFKPASRTISFIIGWLDASYINTIHQDSSKIKVEELLQKINQNDSLQQHLQKRYCS